MSAGHESGARRILCVFPRYAPSFGSFEYAYPLTDGVRAFMPPQGLLVIAAILPADWQVRFIDENIEPARTEDFLWADAVFVSCNSDLRHAHQLQLLAQAQRGGGIPRPQARCACARQQREPGWIEIVVDVGKLDQHGAEISRCGDPLDEFRIGLALAAGERQHGIDHRVRTAEVEQVVGDEATILDDVVQQRRGDDLLGLRRLDGDAALAQCPELRRDAIGDALDVLHIGPANLVALPVMGFPHEGARLGDVHAGAYHGDRATKKGAAAPRDSGPSLASNVPGPVDNCSPGAVFSSDRITLPPVTWPAPWCRRG